MTTSRGALSLSDEAYRLPRFAPFPSDELIGALPPSETRSLLDTYSQLAQVYLQASDKSFYHVVETDSGLQQFLTSYCASKVATRRPAGPSGDSIGVELKRKVFVLVHRVFNSGSYIPPRLLTWDFLAELSSIYLKSEALTALLQSLWPKTGNAVRKGLQVLRNEMVAALEAAGSPSDETLTRLRKLLPLLRSLPQAAAFMAEGTEFPDALAESYGRASISARVTIVTAAYLSLVALTEPETLNRAALLDHLYSLKSLAEKTSQRDTLLADLVTNTPLLSRLTTSPDEKSGGRARSLATSLQVFRNPDLARSRRTRHVSSSKGKSRANGSEEHHMHLMSKISQIQDLFPELGSGFVAKLLDAYHDDIEAATSALLEDSLPSNLASIPRSLALSTSTAAPSSQSAIDSLIPPSTPPHLSNPAPVSVKHYSSSLPIRHNIHDNDALDLLNVPSSQLHIRGQRDTDPGDPTTQHKASVLAALAAFDSDDDERDDTYDEADVGGTVDTAHPDGEDPSSSSGHQIRISSAQNAGADGGGVDEEVEDALYTLWRTDVSAFGRSAEVRRSEGRRALRLRSGWTDEAIEGWAVMLGRDEGRRRRLEARWGDALGAGRGQREVQSTRWRREDDDGDEEDDAGDSTQGPGGRSMPRGGMRGRAGRGRGRGGGGRGGLVAGPAGEKETQVARQRKETGKGSRANHNRRDQRARKMARGGFPAAS